MGPTNDVLDPRLLPPGSVGSISNAPYASNQYSNQPSSNEYKPELPYFGTQARNSSGDGLDNGAPQRRLTDDFDQDEAQQSPNNDDTKRSRACEACRGLKVRCDQDPDFPDRPCKRCAKANRQCVITQPSRKRQKKADNRVADLERKLDALTAALHSQQRGTPTRLDSVDQVSPPTDTLHSASGYGQPQTYPGFSTSSPVEVGADGGKKRKLGNDTTPQQIIEACNASLARGGRPADFDHLGSHHAERLVKSSGDVRRELYHTAPETIIARIRELVDPALHAKLFDRYVCEMAPNMPAVVFPPGTTAEEVLQSKPVLFLCILAAASGGYVSRETSFELGTEVLGVFADCVIRNSSRSLELIQALQVAVLWYRPPEKPEPPNFYQFIHMAACMGLDLGLGRKFAPNKAKRGFGGLGAHLPPGKMTTMLDSDTVESRRAWLTCYHMCASVSMVLRRPNLVRWTNYMQESIEFLDNAPDAVPSDRILTQYIRIQKICEEISVAFSMDDASATAISITDPKVSYTLDVYEQKIKDWEGKLPKEIEQPQMDSVRHQLMFFKDVGELYLHEIAMHVNHNVDDFRMPFTEESLRSGLNISETLTQKQMAALEACLRAAHRIIDAYSSFGLETLANLPTLLFFVRVVYALVVLIKMHLAVSTPNSEIGKIMRPEDLKVEYYIEKLWTTFTALAAKDTTSPHYKIIKILAVLREWHYQHKDKDGKSKEDVPASKATPYGRNPHSSGTDSKLQVLSEAATAGHEQSASWNKGKSKGLYPPAATPDWTFDSPAMFSQGSKIGAANQAAHMYMGGGGVSNSDTPGQQSLSNVSSYTAPTSTTSMYPQSGDGSGQDYNNDSFGNLLPPGADDFDWTANMDLEQVLDGAFRDFDMSGDLGGWFMGDGVGVYQIPGEGAILGNGNNGSNENAW